MAAYSRKAKKKEFQGEFISLRSLLSFEYRAFYRVFPSLSVYSCSRCLCPCFESHFTSLFSTVLLQVSLGRPLFLFPFAALVSAVLGNESGFILNTCPIHLHLRIFTCVLILYDLVLSLTSSSVTFIGQWIFRTFRKHLCWKLSSLCSSLFVMRQVSLPYKRTVRTFELKILVLVPILYWLLFQTLANLLNDDLAFPTLAVISCSAPPVLLTVEPTYVTLSTSSTSFPSINMGVWSLALYLMSFGFLMLVFIPITDLAVFT